jgi:hypothetical protein
MIRDLIILKSIILNSAILTSTVLPKKPADLSLDPVSGQRLQTAQKGRYAPKLKRGER